MPCGIAIMPKHDRSKKYDLIVIGAGASGLFASILYKRRKPEARVLILEKMDKPAKRLLATGNGRCNFLPLRDSKKAFHSSEETEAHAYLESVSFEEVEAYWADLGLEWTLLDNGYYPSSLRAETLVEILLFWVKKLGIELRTDSELVDYEKTDKDFKFLILSKAEEKTTYISRQVLLTVGGQSQKALGGSSNIYSLLAGRGYALEDTFPALLGLPLVKPSKRLQGQRVRAGLRLYQKDAKQAVLLGTDVGEIQFNKTGLSGVPVLQLSGAYTASRKGLDPSPYIYKTEELSLLSSVLDSRDLASYLKDEPDFDRISLSGMGPYFFLLDFFPQISLEDFSTYWEKRMDLFGGDLEQTLLNTLPKQVAIYLAGVLAKDRHKVSSLKAWPWTIAEDFVADNAQVTGGGVKFSNLRDKCPESRLEPGLFLAGEILNIYGDCGGNNLLWAWKSAILVSHALD